MDIKQAIQATKRPPRRNPRRPPNPRSFVSAWSEDERFGNERSKAFVLIFRTTGCRWAATSGCSFCGYSNDTCADVRPEDLTAQLDKAMERYKGEPVVKIYTSGSFLDDEEVPPAIRDAVAGRFAEKGCRRLIAESLPGFVTKERIGALKDSLGGGEFEVALGLESSSDLILQNSINKPFRFNDFAAAASIARKEKARVRTYIVIKPPFLTERDALEDAVSSAEAADHFSDVISFNPINVQRGTLVEWLWKRRTYRSPWLWSVVEVLSRSPKNVTRVSSPSGGGRERGAHNCGECDESVLKCIEDFSLTQDEKAL